MKTEPTIPIVGESGFLGIDRPAEEDLYRCVHCGLCLSACPTYTELDLETESPRGRIALMKAVSEGRLEITQRVASHWDLCLQCRACEAVCPSGVPFGRMMERTRFQVAGQGRQPWRLRLVRILFLRGALPHPRRLKFGAAILGFYQRWGLRALVRWSRLLKLLPGDLSRLEAGLPTISSPSFAPTSRVYRAPGQVQMTVGLLSGCVMPLVHAPTMEATVRVLNRNACDVAVPEGQGCCGALNAHAGDLEMARRMARRNIDVFLSAGVDAIVVASAGCGSTMKEYRELLKDDPGYREEAERFSAMTVDVTEFLAGLPLDPPRGTLEGPVTYQDPCHLAHAQRITAAPRDLLKAVPGIEVLEMDDASRCCGAAGTYSLLHGEMSRRLLQGKVAAIAATGATTVASANPGCMIQLENGLREAGMQVRVRHVVDVLDEAYSRES